MVVKIRRYGSGDPFVRVVSLVIGVDLPGCLE